MYFNGTKCSSLLLCCALSLSAMAKEASITAGTQGLRKPLCFVENKGQITDQDHNERSDVQYNLSTPGMNLYVGNGQLHYQFKKIDASDKNAPTATTYRMDVTLVGANTHAKVIATDKQEYAERYYYPQFGDKGLQVAAYNKIVYKDVYPNIDWVLYVKNNKVEYDFVVREGGNANDIQLKYGGATALSITKDGSISAETPMGTIQEKTPYAYETATGKAVASSFKLHDNIVTFETGAHTGALTIDPYLLWSTYFGGTGEDVATGVAKTNTGIVFVSGYTASTGLSTGGATTPTNAGVTYDAFLAKYSAAGVLTYCTYYGGTGTNTQGMAVAVDNTNTDVYLTGFTASSGLAFGAGISQAANEGLNDAFLVKFNIAGIAQWCTYYGGTNNDYAYGVALDGNNNVYITGQTSSTTFIATAGAYQTALNGTTDAFIAKYLNATGTRIWGTYYGGTAQETAYGIVCDGTNNVIITGQTNSIIDIATAGAYQTSLNGTNDAFVAKFNSGGGITWGTYFGGPSTEQGNSITCNTTTGDIAIAGNTSSNSNIASAYAAQPAYGGGVQDAFVAYFTNSGAVSWSTYLGGASLDYGQGICLDSFKNVVLVGGTFSGTGIGTAGSYQPAIAGDYDAYVVKYTPFGQRLWGTYFGGALYDYANAVSCASNDQIVIAGYTTSTSGIASAGAQQTTNGGGTYDAFVSEFKRDTLVTINQPYTDTLVCAGGTLNVSYTANFNFQAGNTFTVQMSNAAGSFAAPTTIGSVTSSVSGVISCTIPAAASGSGYLIRIVASNPSFTSPDDLYNIDVVASQPPTVAYGSTPVCTGATIYLFDTSSYIVTAYNWSGPNGFTSGLQNPSISGVDPTYAGTYSVTTSHNGCPDITDTVSIVVNTFIPPTPTDSAGVGCLGSTIYLFSNPDTSATVTYNWSGPGGFTSTLQNPTIPASTMADAGYYYVTDTLAGCPSATNFVYVTVNDVTPAAVTITASPSDTICNGAEITFTATETNGGLTPGYQWMTGPGAPIVGATAPTFSSLDLINGETIFCVLTSSALCPTLLNVSSNVITVTVLDNTPLAHITVSPGSMVAPGGTATFSSTVLNPGTLPYYEWVVNGVPVAGITSDVLTLAGITGNDTVTLILHTTMICASPDSAISNTIIIQPTLSVPVMSALSNVSLYPNPNSGSFTLTGTVNGLNANAVLLEVSNSLGQIIYTANAPVQHSEVSKLMELGNIPDGVYTIRVTGDGASNVIRFSVTR